MFQEGVRVSGACRSNYSLGLLRRKKSLPPPRLSRSFGSAHMSANRGVSLDETGQEEGAQAVSAVDKCGQGVGHRSHVLAKDRIMTGHWSDGPKPGFGTICLTSDTMSPPPNNKTW